MGTPPHITILSIVSEMSGQWCKTGKDYTESSKEGWRYEHEACAVTQDPPILEDSPKSGLMLCHHHLAILKNTKSPNFYFVLGPLIIQLTQGQGST